MENSGKRLNKYISDAGVCSRREADRLIAAGLVEIRRKTRKGEAEAEAFPASLGDLVYHGDTVYVKGKELPKKEAVKVCYLYHKPVGVICTTDPEVPENIIAAAGIMQKVSYAGRLDKDSSGLIILTNDGTLSDRLMRASQYHEKEYIVSLQEPVRDDFLAAMREGVRIHLDDEEHLRKNPKGIWVTTRPCRVRKVGERSIAVTLTQGYNRQIRRMCRALGNPVISLKRIRIAGLRLGDLKVGELRKLSAAELETLQKLAETGGSGRKAGSSETVRGGSRSAQSSADRSIKRQSSGGKAKNSASGTGNTARRKKGRGRAGDRFMPKSER